MCCSLWYHVQYAVIERIVIFGKLGVPYYVFKTFVFSLCRCCVRIRLVVFLHSYVEKSG